MREPPDLILASSSAIRAAILKNAGLKFRIAKPEVDEAALKREAAKTDSTLEQVARRLAEAKALSIDAPGALVLGADQILEFEGEALDKAKDRAEARARLLALQGRRHSLINGVAIARDGEIVFGRIDRSFLKMRALAEADIDRYLDRAGDEALASVGAYQIEGLGASLIEAIEGDYFAVLGLSLLPTLAFLRRNGVAAF